MAHLVLSKPESKPNQLWIIDEAGMMSAKQMQEISLKAESVKARILLVGDKGQNSSVEAGSPLRSLIDHGAKTHSISKIIRQQNSTQRQAVELIAEGNGLKALELLNDKGYVTEIEDREERSRSVAQQYLKLSPSERKQTLIVTGTNKERLSITTEIRNGLKASGELTESVKAVQLVSRNLTKEQSSKLHNYQIGDYIKLHRQYKGTPLQKGKLYKVEGSDGNDLLLSSYGGRNYRLNPAQFKDKQVFTSQEIELAVGEQLRWSSGADKHQGQINGKQITVTYFNDMSMNVVDNQGQTQEVSLLQPLPVDYNLVSTSYRAQGKSKKRVIVSATNDPTSSLEPFYVKISRQTKDLTVYTQNLDQLRNWVERSNAQQNPLELIEEYYGKQTSKPTKEKAQISTPTVVSEEPVVETPKPEEKPIESVSLASEEVTTETPKPDELINLDVQREQATADDKPLNSVSNEDSPHQPNVSVEEIENRQLSEPTINDSLSHNHPLKEQIQFSKLEQLVDDISTIQVEAELLDHLHQVNDYLENLEQNLKLEQLETVSGALEEWQLGQDLALAVINFTPSEQPVLDSLLTQIYPEDIQEPKFQELVAAIVDEQSDPDSHLWSHNIQTLAETVFDQQAASALSFHLSQFNETAAQKKKLVQTQLDKLTDSFSDHEIIASSQNTELQNLVSSLESKGAPDRPILDFGLKIFDYRRTQAPDASFRGKSKILKSYNRAIAQSRNQQSASSFF